MCSYIHTFVCWWLYHCNTGYLRLPKKNLRRYSRKSKFTQITYHLPTTKSDNISTILLSYEELRIKGLFKEHEDRVNILLLSKYWVKLLAWENHFYLTFKTIGKSIKKCFNSTNYMTIIRLRMFVVLITI